jgi:large subunit ribosomal protein L17
MRHRSAGKHLNRTPTHRIAMRRNLAGSLFEHGAVVTTMAKAKHVRRFVEKLITIAKKDTVAARRRVKALLGQREIVPVEDGIPLPAEKKSERVTVLSRLFSDIAPRFVDRPGGYTRIIRLGETRIGDSGEKVMLQLLGEEGEAGEPGARSRSQRKKRAAKRREAFKQAVGGKTKTAAGVAEAEAEASEDSAGPSASEQDEQEPSGGQEAEAQAGTEASAEQAGESGDESDEETSQ